MNISAINTYSAQNSSKTNFGGLYGYKIGRGVILNEIDRYFPFSDEVVRNIPKIMRRGSRFAPVRHMTIQEGVLPFTRQEYLAYRAKNGTPLKDVKLTKKEAEIEKFFHHSGEELGISGRNFYPVKQGLLSRISSKFDESSIDTPEYKKYLKFVNKL